MNKNKIELFKESLIDEYSGLALDVLGYASKFGMGLGWHYLLDMIWILKELENSESKTILDAGAGNGLIQFILALKGYEVISVDVNQRLVPSFVKNILNIEIIGSQSYINHPYLKWHGVKESSSIERSSFVVSSGLPTIQYYHADLSHMDLLKDNSVDAIVALSSLEHNPPEKLGSVLKELQRVLKGNRPMMITVSAGKKSFFHQPSFSWILSEEDMKKTYGLRDDTHSNFDRFDEIFDGLCNSRRLKDWLAGFYYQGEKNGMPLGKWNPEYSPVGLRVYNSK